MALVYTAEELIESIRNLGMVPDSGTLGGDDADIIRHINEEMSLSLIPELIEKRQEYYVVTTRITLVSNTLKYRIPTRAIGDKLRFVRWVDTSGDKDVDPLEEITPEHFHEYSWSTTTEPEGYYIEGNYICLIGNTFSGYLEISWYFRPGQLVLSTDARKITVINSKTVTLSADVPTTWSTANKFDIHSAESGAEIKMWGETASAVGGSGLTTKITFTNSIDGSVFGTHPLEVGDWVCLEKEAAIPAIPVDLHPLLIRAAAMRMAEARGDAQMVKMENELFEKCKKQILPLVTNRSGKTQKIRGCRGILWQQSSAR
jgi:hypothetical protein